VLLPFMCASPCPQRPSTEGQHDPVHIAFPNSPTKEINSKEPGPQVKDLRQALLFQASIVNC